jgi:hypothetical protein
VFLGVEPPRASIPTTEEQWQELRFAVQDTMAFVAFANGAHFWETIKEATATAKYIGSQAKESQSTLVRDLAGAGGTKHEKLNPSDPAAFEKAVLDTIAEASKIVADTAADELDAFKAFVIGVAQAAAVSSGAVDDDEQTAIDKIKGALV